MLRSGVYAGTFGPLHNGHMKIIDIAMDVVKHLTIGVTLDSMAQRKIKGTQQRMSSFRERVRAISLYMEAAGYDDSRYSIVPVSDGVAEGVGFSGDVIFVSDEESVISRVNHINLLRRLKKLPELIAVVVPRLRLEDGTVLSSTLIRKKVVEAPEYDIRMSGLNW